MTESQHTLDPHTVATIVVYKWNAEKPSRSRMRNFPHELRDAIADAIREERARMYERAVRAEELAAKLGAQLDEAESRLNQLLWASDMACENTPNPKCECPGCETARARAENGEAGP